jgi:predicted ATPase/serine phosphatase RsbU (regulator of sigma subunit)
MNMIFPNYHSLTLIYESNNSLIYRALRQEDNEAVILKVLKQDYPTSEELNRYWQEYDILKSFDLDGVIKSYGIQKYENTLIIILEDFGGESLKQSKIQCGSIKTFLLAAIQIANNLSKIHAAQVIHKDINPANLVWNKTTDQLKIIDFGIASRLPRENPTLKNPEQLEGTLAYLSPEQTGRINRSLDYRTDLYSLGVTFYEMLSGKLPFESTDAMELVHCHIAKMPEPVCEINADVPQILNNIVMKLMAKNAEDRYQSALGLKSDLETCLDHLENLYNLGALSFQLAKQDFSTQLHIPQQLYGREREVNQLLQAFERVSQGGCELMLVTGYSGVGKSALVYEVHKPMTEKRGYFAAGKFEQYQRNIPYSALSNAFNAFCHYLLTESTAQLTQWREIILNAVGNNGQVLIDVIPQLALILGQQPAATAVGAIEAQNRFNLVFQSFIRAISQAEHPLILFIDDLQWADSASLHLLKFLMTENQYFLMIGAYRDNEVDAAHPLMRLLDELQKAEITVNTLHLQNLSIADLNHLLTESLMSSSCEVERLTQLVYEKTHGNAFFTHEFLKSLYDEALLVFDIKAQKWQWDIRKIAAKEMTDNVVALMAGKIEKLSTNTIAVLKLAACIGNQFDLLTLSIIYPFSKVDTLEHLWEAIEGGLIWHLDENYKRLDKREKAVATTRFQFQHDRIQQAAYSLIPETQRPVLHLEMGRLLKANIIDLDDKLFDIVDHFNLGIFLLQNEREAYEIAQLNLSAGKKAKAAAAYEPALRYLNMGRELLAEDSWQEEYELTLALYMESAETAYLTGEFEQMDSLATAIQQQARSLLDKVRVYEVRIDALQAQNQLLDAVQMGLEILALLGITFPALPSEKDFMPALQATQSCLAGQSIEALIGLPEMTEPVNLAAMRILSRVFSASYQAVPALMPLFVFKQVNLSVQFGNTAESAFAYANYGLILCAIVSDIDSGYQFGQLALNLLEGLQAKELKARTFVIINNLVRHWKEPVKDTLSPLLEGYESGLETGDLEWAAWCIVVHDYHAYLSGQPLPELEEDMAVYCNKIAQLKQETPLHWEEMYRQAVLNLMSENSGFRDQTPWLLIGESYNEEKMLPLHLKANDRTAISHFYLNKIMLCYLFRAYEQAVENATLAEKYLDGAVGLLVGPFYHFYDSLARLAVYPKHPNPESLLNQVNLNQEKMKNWAHHAPANYQHKFDLVEAEKARLLGDKWLAAQLYEKAIAGANQHDYLQEAALAYELAAHFYAEQGMIKFAQTYLRDAYYTYYKWGAMAKVRHLLDNSPQWLAHHLSQNETATVTKNDTVMLYTQFTRQNPSTLLDLESVIKAAQTLSQEIVLSRLLEKIMHTMIENGGAERGVLILKKEENWVIEAEGAINLNEISVLQAIPIEGQLPTSIINYVVRTYQAVVFANAMQETLYSEDAYIRAHQTLSVLCSPILHQGQLIGLLYLENNLMQGAFTPARLKVLEILSSQLAISLENALLYRTLEQKVEQRTAQLAQANDQITLLNQRLEAENMRMSAELDVAQKLQKMVLPSDPELKRIEGLDIAGFMAPADEVGGDYYDVQVQEGRVKIGIGDVTGHGLESGVLMLMLQTAVETLLTTDIQNPETFLILLNRAIYKNVQRMGIDKNLTLSLLDYQAGRVSLTGQHEEILVVRQFGKIERIDTIDLGFSIGVVADIAQFVSRHEIQLEKGDGIVLYTDGITEARNLEMALYGLDRLCEIISDNWDRSATAIQQAIITDVRQYIGSQKVYDDITLLVLKQK